MLHKDKEVSGISRDSRDSRDNGVSRVSRVSGDSRGRDSTSVRESVPWAIDEDASNFACNPTGLGISALGVAVNYNATIVAGSGTSAATAYAEALALPSISATAPDCVPWTIGMLIAIMAIYHRFAESAQPTQPQPNSQPAAAGTLLLGSKEATG